MVIGRPEAASTPIAVPTIKCRNNIKDNSVQSPIELSAKMTNGSDLSPRNQEPLMLSTKNYRHWSLSVREELEENNCWAAVEPGYSKVVTRDQKISNSKAMEIIVAAINGDTWDLISDCKTAKDAWQRLRTIYGSQSSPNRSTSRSPSRSPERYVDNSRTRLAYPYYTQEANFKGQYSNQKRNSPNKERSTIMQKDSGTSNWIKIGIPTVVLLLVALYFVRAESSPKPEKEDLSEIFQKNIEKFPYQDDDFWSSVRVNIEEIVRNDSPRSIMFLYEDKTKKTLDNIVSWISKTAIGFLTNSSEKPVKISGLTLTSPDIVNDYGKIIADNRDNLEATGVMIVENLERVPGRSAQVFHSFCDEVSPVVKKALIIFTLKVNSLPKDNLTAFVENLLLKQWSDIGKDDKFEPLFARISATILAVKSE